jgi:hypothetical protein
MGIQCRAVDEIVLSLQGLQLLQQYLPSNRRSKTQKLVLKLLCFLFYISAEPDEVWASPILASELNHLRSGGQFIFDVESCRKLAFAFALFEEQAYPIFALSTGSMQFRSWVS